MLFLSRRPLLFVMRLSHGDLAFEAHVSARKQKHVLWYYRCLQYVVVLLLDCRELCGLCGSKGSGTIRDGTWTKCQNMR